MLFALCAIAAVAQEREYRPFCEEGKTWHTDYYYLLSGDWSSAVTCLKGDTLIAGRSCKKCYTGDLYGGAFYDNGSCTYYIAPNSTKSEKIYDFSVSTGDAIEVVSLYENEKKHFIVTDTKEMTRSGLTFKEITLTDGSKYEDGSACLWTWIEGVGNNSGPLQSSAYSMSFAPVTSCTVSGETLYTSDEPFHLSNAEEIAEGHFDFTFRPFTQENKHWVVKRQKESQYVEYMLGGDTVIAGQSCKKMFEDKEYIGAFFDSNKYHTYFIPKETDVPYLYYNFCLWEGNSTHVWQDGITAYLYCSYPGSFNNTNHTLLKMRFVHLLNEADNEGTLLKEHASDWAEGIGSLNGPMVNFSLPSSAETSDELLACWTPDEIIYDPQGLAAAHFTTIPTTSVSPTYDLSGRRMSSPHARGIYIEGGKKVVR